MRTILEKKVILSVAILATTVSLILASVIWPAAKQILKINQETDALLKTVELRYENAKNIRKNLSKTQSIREEVVGFNKFIFTKDDGLKLITLLESIADKNGVTQKIENSNIDNPAAEYTEVNITVQGNFIKTFGYLVDLENTDYFINIGSLELTTAPSRTATKNEQNINIRLSINLYAGNK
ncbi:MAG: hypothetical protein Q7S66_00390 [bacterium]|nr:hypothetical protein [bacterium]